VALVIAALGLVACGGSTAPVNLPQRATPLPSPGPSSATTISFTVSASSATTQQLGRANGIVPTLTVAAGATSSSFTLTATTSSVAPAGTPSLSGLGIGPSAAYITLSSSNGPAALNDDMTITVPASEISGPAVNAIFIPDGKSGSEATRRVASGRGIASAPAAGSIIAVAAAEINGSYTVSIPGQSFSGTVVIAPGANAVPANCAAITDIGYVCLGTVALEPNGGYLAQLPITTEDSTAANAFTYYGLLSPSHTCAFVSQAVSVSGSNATLDTEVENAFGSSCDVYWTSPAFDHVLSYVSYSLNLSAPSSPVPSPSPSPAGPSLAFYRATDNLRTNTATYPANPGEGPVNAIADEIAADTQAFIYPVGTGLTAASGTYTVALVPTGSSAFCAASTFIYAAYTNTGAATINASTFPYPADGLNIELSDPNHATDVGACTLQFTGGGATADIPLMVNPLSISGNNSGGAFYDSLAAGGSFTIAVNPAAYTAAGLAVPASLQLDIIDEYYVNPAAGLTSGGAPGAPSCFDAGVAVQLSGSGPYTLTFPPTASETNAGSECEVYLTDGVTGAPLDFLINLRS